MSNKTVTRMIDIICVLLMIGIGFGVVLIYSMLTGRVV